MSPNELVAQSFSRAEIEKRMAKVQGLEDKQKTSMEWSHPIKLRLGYDDERREA